MSEVRDTPSGPTAALAASIRLASSSVFPSLFRQTISNPNRNIASPPSLSQSPSSVIGSMNAATDSPLFIPIPYASTELPLRELHLALDEALDKSKNPVSEFHRADLFLPTSGQQDDLRRHRELMAVLLSMPREHAKSLSWSAVAHYAVQHLPNLLGATKGRGIVMTAVAEDWSLVVLSVRVARSLNCNLPIEVFFTPSNEPSLEVRSELIRNNAVAKPLSGDFEDSLSQNRHAIVPIAVLFSSFGDVLYLRPGTILTRNPYCLFDLPAYQRTGVVIWNTRDFYPLDLPIWQAIGRMPNATSLESAFKASMSPLKYSKQPSSSSSDHPTSAAHDPSSQSQDIPFDLSSPAYLNAGEIRQRPASSQLMMSKTKLHRLALLVAAHLYFYHDIYAPLLKLLANSNDFTPLAFYALKLPFHAVEYPNALVGSYEDNRFCSAGSLWFDSEGVPFFFSMNENFIDSLESQPVARKITHVHRMRTLYETAFGPSEQQSTDNSAPACGKVAFGEVVPASTAHFSDSHILDYESEVASAWRGIRTLPISAESSELTAPARRTTLN